MYQCKYFSIKELVSKQVFSKFGLSAWMFFEENLLKDLDTIREYHGKSITINDWAWGGNLQQCGLRCNLDPLVKDKKTIYCSAHIMGKAFDLHSSDNKKLQNDIITLANANKLKAIRRLESSKSTKFDWVHVDSFRTNQILEIFVA